MSMPASLANWLTVWVERAITMTDSKTSNSLLGEQMLPTMIIATVYPSHPKLKSKLDVLRFLKGEDEATSATLREECEVAVSLATEGGHHIVGIDVMGASAYLPLGKLGYDPDTYFLSFGSTPCDAVVTEHCDIICY